MTSATATQSAHETPGARRAGAGSGGEPDRAQNLQAFLVELLAVQCRLVGAACGFVFLLPTGTRRGGLIARYFTGEESGAATSSELAVALAPGGPLAERVERLALDATGAAGTPNGQGRRPGVVETLSLPRPGGLYQAEPSHRAIAFPLVAEGRTEGACVLLVPGRQAFDESDALGRLALTTSRFEAYLWRQQCLSEAQQRAKLRETLELLDTAQQGASAEAMGSLFCHELQRRFGCTRVSIGLVWRDRIRLTAVSGADSLDRRGEAVGAIEAAMEECGDQDAEIVFPPPPEAEADPAQRRVTRAHSVLSGRFGPAAILSLPLRVDGDLVGVVLLEREEQDPFPAGAVPLLRLVAEFIGPLLWTRRLADRGILAVTRDRAIDFGHAIVGPRHTGKKLLGLTALAALALAAAVPIPDRIGAVAEIAAETSRTLAAPYTGYLASASVRPGDVVEAGQVIATMDTSDLRLQLAESEAEAARLRTELSSAQAAPDHGRARALEASLGGIEAHTEKLRQFIARSQVRAPISGMVAQGDLDPFINARVEPTQPLYVIVAATNIAVLQVDERSIGEVAVGDTGWFAAKALPEHKVPLRVTRINPVAEAVAGANIYKVEAELLGPSPWLKPGMTGSAKLENGSTTGLKWLLGPIVDAARLRLWW